MAFGDVNRSWRGWTRAHATIIDRARLPGRVPGRSWLENWGRSDFQQSEHGRDWCVQWGVPGRAHGLRKILGEQRRGSPSAYRNVRLAHAQNGRAIHTRAADQQRLAEAAMRILDLQEQIGAETCPTEAPESKLIFRCGAPGEVPNDG